MIPAKKDFTDAEWEVVCRCRTPYQVQQYLNSLPYNDEAKRETLRTFRGVVAHQSSHCLEAALSAATILEQHGYPPLLLDIESQDHLDHVVFLYQRDGKWGTVARSRDPGLHGRKPVFDSIRDLVESYAAPFVDYSGRIIGFGTYELSTLDDCDWRFSKRNVWHVQDVLIGIPHERFHMPDADYDFWFTRYKAYRHRFPNRKPLYYPNRRCWTAGYPRGS